MSANKTTESVESRIAQEKSNIIAQLAKVPIVQIACERVGVGRSTFYRWCSQDPIFAEQARSAVMEGKAMVNDMAESQLISSIKDKSFQAIAYWLKHNHPDYRTRVEFTPSTPQESLTPEQEQKVLSALRLITSNNEESYEEAK